MFGISDEVEDGGEVRRRGREETEEEGEEGDVAFVAYVNRFVCAESQEGVDGGGMSSLPLSSTLASQYIFSASFQCRSASKLVSRSRGVEKPRLTINIRNNPFVILLKLDNIIRLPQKLRNLSHSLRKESHPRNQIEMNLSQMRRFRSRIVVQSTREYMIGRPTSPAIRLRTRIRLSTPFFDLTALSFSEPVVVQLQPGVDRREEFLSEEGRVDMTSSELFGRSLRSRGNIERVEILERDAGSLESIDVGGDGHSERRRIRIAWILSLEFRRHL